MSALPTMMDFGSFNLISPDGSDQIPADLWPELELMILLEPEPTEIKAWTRRLEDRLGVTAAHRQALRPATWQSTGAPWTILCVTSLMERKVAETLTEEAERRGIGLQVYVPVETYLPKTANVARAHRPWRPRTRALIPGVIFARLADDAALDFARSNHAVRRIMCRDGQPVKLPAMEIGALVLAEAFGDFDSTRRHSGARKGRRRGRRGAGPESRWKSGQRVKIGDGPFAGFLGTVMRSDREGRLEVLVSIFGRESAVSLEEAMIDEGDGDA